MSDVWDWKEAAADNQRQPPDGFPEGQSKPSYNDSHRELMAGFARSLRDFPWLNLTKPQSYARRGDFQFDVVGGDFQGIFSVGRQVKIEGQGSTIVGNVTFVAQQGSAGNDGVTVVTIVTSDASIIVPLDPILRVYVSLVDRSAGLALASDVPPAAIFNQFKLGLNLVTDGGFENGEPGLYYTQGTGATWEIVEESETGLYAMRMESDGSGAGGAVGKKSVFIAANSAHHPTDSTGHVAVGRKPYVFECSYKYIGTPPFGDVTFKVQYYSANGTLVDEVSKTMPAPTLNWVRNSELFRPPNVLSAVYAVFVIQVGLDQSAGFRIYFDNWDVREQVASEIALESATGVFEDSATDVSVFDGSGGDSETWVDIVAVEPISILGDDQGDDSLVRIESALYGSVPQIYGHPSTDTGSMGEASFTGPTVQFRLVWDDDPPPGPGNPVVLFTSEPVNVCIVGEFAIPLPEYVTLRSPVTGVRLTLQALWHEPLYAEGTVTIDGTPVITQVVSGTGTRWLDFVSAQFGLAAAGLSSMRIRLKPGMGYPDETWHSILTVDANDSLRVFLAQVYTVDVTDAEYEIAYDPSHPSPGLQKTTELQLDVSLATLRLIEYRR